MSQSDYESKIKSLTIYKRRYSNAFLCVGIFMFLFIGVWDNVWSWKDALLVITIPISVWYLICKFVFKKIK
jgi:hypothetical protein